MIEILNKVGIEGTFINIIKATYDKPIANIILGSQKLKAFPLRPGTRQGCPLLPLLFNIVLEVLILVTVDDGILPKIIRTNKCIQAGYKINIQKCVVFLYTNNEVSEREIRKYFEVMKIKCNK